MAWSINTTYNPIETTPQSHKFYSSQICHHFPTYNLRLIYNRRLRLAMSPGQRFAFRKSSFML